MHFNALQILLHVVFGKYSYCPPRGKISVPIQTNTTLKFKLNRRLLHFTTQGYFGASWRSRPSRAGKVEVCLLQFEKKTEREREREQKSQAVSRQMIR